MNELDKILFDLCADCILASTLKTGDTGVDKAKAQILKSFTPNHEVEQLVNQGIQNFITRQTIIEKFETLAEYIPKQFQSGYIEGMREEVDDFIVELQSILAPIDRRGE